MRWFRLFGAAAACCAALSCSSSSSPGTEPASGPGTAPPSAAPTTLNEALIEMRDRAFRESVDDFFEDLRGRFEVTLVGTRTASAQYPGDPEAPYLCATFDVRNVGRSDATIGVSDFRAVDPRGQIVTSAGGGLVVTGSEVLLWLVPGGTGVLEPCFATGGVAGDYVVQYRPHASDAAEWPVRV